MFYSVFIYLCSKVKVSPLKVAEDCGFDEGDFWDWKNKFEKGEDVNLSADILLKLSKYFKVSVDCLLDNEPNLDLSSEKNKFLFLENKGDMYSLVSDEPFIINHKEVEIIKAYRSNPQKQKTVDDILNIKKDDSK